MREDTKAKVAKPQPKQPKLPQRRTTQLPEKLLPCWRATPETRCPSLRSLGFALGFF